jgi:23S rRNA (cytosine1962-C5)-methyltransferase
VVDRFFDILVVQLASATMEAHKDEVIAALIQVLKPSGILFKNDSAARDAEGLERYVDTVYGEVPDWVALEENGVKFEAPVREGQKTGWFYDHRMNRARLAPYVKASAYSTCSATSVAGACRPAHSAPAKCSAWTPRASPSTASSAMPH